MSDPFLEAVKAVPHDENCRDHQHDGGGCRCDRDERIAKGAHAAFRVISANMLGGRVAPWPEITAAFTEAARG